MSLNGAGIGSEIIQAKQKQIHKARHQVPDVFTAAAPGVLMPFKLVLHTDLEIIHS
jgi:hypothetical protein